MFQDGSVKTILSASSTSVVVSARVSTRRHTTQSDCPAHSTHTRHTVAQPRHSFQRFLGSASGMSTSLNSPLPPQGRQATYLARSRLPDAKTHADPLHAKVHAPHALCTTPRARPRGTRCERRASSLDTLISRAANTSFKRFPFNNFKHF